MATPPSITNTLLIDLDPDASTGTLVDNDPVSTLEDVSGNNRDFTQATSAAKPTFRTNQLNGYPVIVTDGVDDHIGNVATGIGTKAGATVFLVMAQDSQSGLREGIMMSAKNATREDYEQGTGESFYLGTLDSSAFDSLVVAGVPADPNEQDLKTSSTAFDTFVAVTADLRVATATTTVYVNGTAEGTTASAAGLNFDMSVMRLGCRQYSSSPRDFGPHKYARVLAYDGAVSTGDRATIHSWIQETYGITVSDYVASDNPANLDVVVTGDDAALTWDAASPTPTDYSVYRRTPQTGADFTPPGSPVASGVATTSYADNNLSNASYDWQVFGRYAGQAAGAISARAAGTWADSTATTLAVTIPAGATTGDMMLMHVACKPYTATPTVDQGWTAVGTAFADGAVASGNGTGSVKVLDFYKQHTGSESNPTITWGTTSTPGAAVIVAFQKASGTWVTPVGDGGGMAAGTNVTATIQSHVSAASGDMLVEFHGIRDDGTTPTVPTVTQTGLTLAAVTEYPAAAHNSATSNDISADGCYRLATAGTSSAAAVATGTLATSETGAAWVTRLRTAVIAVTYSAGSIVVQDTVAAGATLVVADLALSLTTDGPTLTQVHSIVVQDVALALTEDVPTLTQVHTLAGVADLALSLSEDAAGVLVQNSSLVVQDVSLALTEDVVILTQVHNLTVQDVALSLAEDATGALVQNFTLVVQDIALSLSTDNVTLTQAHNLAVADVALALSEDAVALVVDLNVADLALSLTTDNAVLTQVHVLAVDDIALALTEDAVTLSVATDLVVADLGFTLTIGGAAELLSAEEQSIEGPGALEWEAVSGATVARTTDAAHAGTSSLEIDASGGWLIRLVTLIAAAPGDSPDLSLWLRNDVNMFPRVYLRYLDSLGGILQDFTVDPTENLSDWYEATVSGTAPANTTHLQILVQGFVGLIPAYLDDASLLGGDDLTLTQVHNLTVDDVALALSEDTPTLTQVHSLTVADLALALSVETLTLTGGAALEVDDLTLSLSTDNVTLTQQHTLAVDDVMLSLTEDAPSLTQAHQLTVADVALSLTEDAVVLEAQVTLVVADLALGLALDAPTLTQAHQLVVQDLSLTLSEDSPALTQVHTLVVNDLTLGLGVEATGDLTGGSTLTVADLSLGLSVDTPVLTQAHNLTVADLRLSLSADPAVLTQVHDLAVADLLLALRLDPLALVDTSGWYDLDTVARALGIAWSAAPVPEGWLVNALPGWSAQEDP